MRKIFLLFFVMLAISITVQAQNRTITGKVLSSDDNTPLIGVTITVKGSSAATATDVDGKFSIKTTNLQNVVIGAKFIGYEYQEITLKPGVMMCNFKLVATNSSLNEVVVTGYGTTLKSKVLGSVAEIKAADIEDLPVANLGTTLKNRLPGIGVSVASGKPGATTTISIRNPTTFSGGLLGITADPLYVIDGLISTADDFNQLDASLVESISFLKDASAAIYGAAGDKGVVIVNTKKGKPGKTQITYSGYYGNSDATQTPQMLTAYQQAKLLNDGYALNNDVFTKRFSQADLDFLATNPYPSWYKTLWHSSSLVRHTINLSGGTDKLTFFGGGSYYNEGGNYATITSTKYNIRSGLTAKLTDDITAFISLNAGYNKDFSNTIKGSVSDTETQQTLALITTPEWVPLMINGLPNNYQDLNPPGAWNPIALSNSGTYATTNSNTINLNSSIEWRPHFVKGLTLKVQYGKNNNSGTSKQYDSPYTVYNFTRTGQNSKLYSNVPMAGKPSQIVANSDQLQEGTSYTNSYELITSADYSRTIGKHTFDVLVLADQTESESNNTLTYRTTQLIPGVDQFFAYGASSTQVQLNGAQESGKRSYLGRLNYDFSNKYLLQVIARVDGSANFPSDKRWGLFPAVGLGWRVSEEKWFKDNLSKYINSLKLRANIGLVGDDRVNAYQYLALFTQTTGALFGSTVTNGLNPSIFPNPSITWEKARTQNYGVDATFLNDKLTLTMDIWNRHTYDGFQDRTVAGLPATVGLKVGIVNYAIQNNWGSEFDLGYLGTVSKDWSYQVNVNFAFSNDQLVQAYYSTSAYGTSQEYQNVPIGHSSHTYNSNNYGYIATGIIRSQAEVDAILAKDPNYTINGQKPQPGFMNFKDLNNDGKIDGNDIGLMYPSTNSPVGFGITLGAAYKTFKFSVNGNLTVGGKLQYDGAAKKAPSPTLNGPSFWADHWTPENPNAKYPRSDAPLAGESSTFWTVNGTQSRINNMSLSWGMPKGLSDKLGIPNFRVLLSGTNLWNIVNPFPYKDPATGSFSSYPTLRTFSLGVNVTL